MRFGIASSMLIVVSLISGCASGPGLGYPAKAVGIPTKVTLFSTIVNQGRTVQQTDIGSAEIWKFLYKGKYEDMFARIRLEELQDLLDAKFLESAAGKSALFSLDPVQVFSWGVQYVASMDDSKEHSGFDFSNYKDEAPAPYILALTIDDWGYIVNRDKEKDGPFVSVALRLIEKDTGKSLWKFSKTFQDRIVDPLGDVNYGSIDEKQIASVYRQLITQAVSQIFTDLGE